MAEKVLKFPHMKDIRDDHDMTQKDVAKLLNCSQAAYSYYEKGYHYYQRFDCDFMTFKQIIKESMKTKKIKQEIRLPNKT